MAEQEQDRSEEATPFKLQRAREKGQVARGADLGFVGSLAAMAVFLMWFGSAFATDMARLMHSALTTGVARAGQTGEVLAIVRGSYWLALQPLVVLGAIIVILLVTLEIVQLRGLFFTAAPLKPDFQRLNPAAGIKRLFSVRMLKEAAKNVVKMAVYAWIGWVMINWAIGTFADSIGDARALVRAMDGAAMRMLLAFGCAAMFFMLLDQVIARREFGKQMRMSRRELKREVRDREGEARIKQKRRQLHAEMRKQAEGLANMGGSDFVIVNPEHYAVALRYVPAEMHAPQIAARGRNHLAQLMKRKARLLGIPVVADPLLARGLFRDGRQGQAIPSQHFHAVARHYSRKRLLQSSDGPDAATAAAATINHAPADPAPAEDKDT